MTCQKISSGIVCFSPEAESTGLDLRTREGQEELVLRQLREHGGFSIFWVTDNQKRACAAQRLRDSKRIIPLDSQYPFCKYVVAADNGETV